MTAQVQQALQRYLAAERELEHARWALLDAANISAHNEHVATTDAGRSSAARFDADAGRALEVLRVPSREDEPDRTASGARSVAP